MTAINTPKYVLNPCATCEPDGHDHDDAEEAVDGTRQQHLGLGVGVPPLELLLAEHALVPVGPREREVDILKNVKTFVEFASMALEVLGGSRFCYGHRDKMKEHNHHKHH